MAWLDDETLTVLAEDYLAFINYQPGSAGKAAGVPATAPATSRPSRPPGFDFDAVAGQAGPLNEKERTMPQETMFGGGEEKSATLSPCGRYRYTLGRAWDDSRPRVVFVMLNPSTADAANDDQTIAKCIGFAKRWGCGGFAVVNLFAIRQTESKGIGTLPEHVGPENDAHILAAVAGAEKVVCAWGAQPKIAARVAAVLAMLGRAGVATYRIGAATKDGHPSHPLMLGYERKLEPMDAPAGALNEKRGVA